MEGQEVWKNATQAQIVLQRSAGQGLIRHELITGGRTFTITAEERRMNQNLAANEMLDCFSNGALIPLKLPPETEVEIKENPNHIADDQLPQFFKLHWRTFEKRIDEISNALVLEQLLEIGPEKDATVKQMSVIQARLDVLHPTTAPRDTDGDGMPRIKPVTPR